jgi:hypothetical protein
MRTDRAFGTRCPKSPQIGISVRETCWPKVVPGLGPRSVRAKEASVPGESERASSLRHPERTDWSSLLSRIYVSQ